MSLRRESGGAMWKLVAETGGNGHGEVDHGAPGRWSGNGSSGYVVDASEDAAEAAVAAAFAELVDSADRRTEAPGAAGGGRCWRRSVRALEK